MHEIIMIIKRRLWRAAFHLLYPVAVLLNSLLHERWGFLNVAELALFLRHFLSSLAGDRKILHAVLDSPLMRGACLHYNVKVHCLAVLLSYIRVIDCAFHMCCKLDSYGIYSILLIPNVKMEIDICVSELVII